MPFSQIKNTIVHLYEDWKKSGWHNIITYIYNQFFNCYKYILFFPRRYFFYMVVRGEGAFIIAIAQYKFLKRNKVTRQKVLSVRVQLKVI